MKPVQQGRECRKVEGTSIRKPRALVPMAHRLQHVGDFALVQNAVAILVELMERFAEGICGRDYIRDNLVYNVDGLAEMRAQHPRERGERLRRKRRPPLCASTMALLLL